MTSAKNQQSIFIKIRRGHGAGRGDDVSFALSTVNHTDTVAQLFADDEFLRHISNNFADLLDEGLNNTPGHRFQDHFLLICTGQRLDQYLDAPLNADPPGVLDADHLDLLLQ